METTGINRHSEFTQICELNSQGVQNLNALFGVAYRESRDIQPPSWATRVLTDSNRQRNVAKNYRVESALVSVQLPPLIGPPFGLQNYGQCL